MSKSSGARSTPRNTAPATPATPVMPPVLRILGSLLLLTAAGAALVLALDHFALVSPPGCGPQSGCDRATRSPWGTIPIINWPTSLAGVAYFSGLLVAWLMSSRGISALFRAIVWLGLAGSIVLVAVMLRNGYVCKYCLVTHIANALFVGVMEVAISRTARSTSARPLAFGAAAFILFSMVLGAVSAQTAAKRLARDEVARKEATGEIIARAQQPEAETPSTGETTQPAPAPADVKPFTGRWRLGPENAPIRIVMFMDYQCGDCRTMESQAMSIVRQRSDVSLSVKHFPMCADCNPNMGGRTLHPNACWAARAAETAGILRGNDGFWQMHQWLLQRGGAFTDAELPPALQSMGYNPQEFIRMMTSAVTLRTVVSDIDEGADLGLHFTPMIFINGVELRGFIGNPGALTRTVDELASRNLPPGSPTQDQPVRAAQKYIDDWRLQPVRRLTADARPRTLGNPNARIRVSVWGDLQEKFTAELDQAIRAQIAAGRDILYEFRMYPADQTCNPHVQRTLHPAACLAARAAEAAGLLGGDAAYWKMHEWLLANQTGLDLEAIRRGAVAVGLDSAALVEAMNNAEVLAAIGDDTQTGSTHVVSGNIPTLYVNSRYVPRWKLQGQSILDRIFDNAARMP